MRIAVAGFQHETNTFVDVPTDLAHFEMADSWPGLLTGRAVVEETRGMNLPIAGFAAAAGAAGAQVEPILWCAAEPSGRVTDAAFEEITERILHGLSQIGQVDGVYLDLHGAMVTPRFEDGEGEILLRIRERIGANVPLVASLDMHANVSRNMVDQSDALTIYRTYPHLDMAATGARAFDAMCRIMKGGWAKAWRQGGRLIPLPAQYTGDDPIRGLYRLLDDFEADALAEVALGFTAADIHDMGPSVVAYGSTQERADAIAECVLERLEYTADAIEMDLATPDEAVARAVTFGGTKPVVIADVQDNPGAGAASDTTGLLRALIARNAPSAIVGLLHDAELASMAHSSGVGTVFEAPVGGRGDVEGPLMARVEVLALSDGQCRYSGQMYSGGTATMGPTARLAIAGTGISVVVTSIRNQCVDQAQFAHLGVDLSSIGIICVKSTAHFRADFAPIAAEVILAAAPGLFPCRLKEVGYQNLRHGVEY